jgi:hypothetical protein
MKTCFIVVMIVCFSSVVSAQSGSDPDVIGLFFDLDGLAIEYNTVAPFENVVVYLLILNPTDPDGVSGWECSVGMTGTAIAPAWELAAGFNVAEATLGLFSVGIGIVPDALHATPAVLLASWTAFIMNPSDVVSLTVAAFPGSISFDGTPGYASGSDGSVLIPLELSPGCWSNGSVLINEICVIPTEAATMSEVKKIFR